MAYGNWGAFVHKNGERRKDKEDVAVFNTDESEFNSGYRIFANLLKNREKYPEGQTPWHEHSHHAVLGDGMVRLCGYKCWAELWVTKPNGEVHQIELPDLCTNDGEIQDATYSFWIPKEEIPKESKEVYEKSQGHYQYSLHHYNGNMIDLRFVEPDGTEWSATCGYEYGAGHME